ncbi:MAG: MBL fold metallo-hydrolase [Candidatus Adiutrix sp.]|jgi:phosphoribosyl 1,2-cyclic phosphodiesterase|nr:MBL fold metallo-hydrolase [Candidatus Adiutrix sp.]
MKFCLLASGSRGNAVWVEEGGLALLVDCGLSAKEFKVRAALAGLDVGKLAAIMISHEHRDHISGVGPLARALGLTVIANAATHEAASQIIGLTVCEKIRTGDSMNLGPLKIRTIPISHDAVDPVSFLIESDAGALGLATDMGTPTGLMRQKFLGLRALILEFNHDYRLLMDGPYPWPLKQRVRSRIGHLANDAAAELAAELHHRDLRHLVLAHLSETNNRPDLAAKAAREALNEAIEPVVASQHAPTIVFEF